MATQYRKKPVAIEAMRAAKDYADASIETLRSGR